MIWFQGFLVLLGILAIWRLGLMVWVRTVQAYHQVELWSLERRRLEGRLVERIYPGDDGLYPVMVLGNQVLDVSRGVTFDLAGGGVRTVNEGLAKPALLSQILKAAGGWPRRGESDGGLLTPVPDDAVRWPDVVRLVDLFGSRPVTINDLVVGVTVTESGEQQVVSASLHRLMHVLSVGAPGWGKSVWLRSFLWQLAQCREAVEVVAIDPFGSEFNVLRGWGRLRWPVARTVDDAATVLEGVRREVERRRDLYEDVPMATNLVEYNRLSEGDELVPVVVVFDEGTATLNAGAVGRPLRDVVQTARQYGVYVLLAGQSAKARVVDTQTRDQFSTRMCFRTSPGSSRVVLDDGAAAGLTVAGRAMCQLTGQELVELQGPWIGRDDFVAALRNGGPRLPMPDVGMERRPPGLDDGVVDGIVAMFEAGDSMTSIAGQMFGHSNGFYIGKVREVLRQRQLIE